ncbi:MAG: AraC family transcriptional regulator [Clostridiales bacterium]|nr:AraC family transcriptional regulator [Clostridiales bacterium]
MQFFFEHHGLGDNKLFFVNHMKEQSFPAHLHRAFEIIYVNRGKLSALIDQKRYSLTAGEFVFVFCNQVHSFFASPDADITIVLFSPEMIGSFYSAYKNSIPSINFLRMEHTPDFDNLPSVYAQKGALYTICDALLQSSDMVTANNHTHVSIIQQIFAYVDKHYNETCTLRTVSTALQYDYAYISKLFTRLAGMHFTQYLNNYRIAQACYMLSSGAYAISDIASSCGYTEQRTFNRNFRNIMNCSPTEHSNLRMITP